MRQARTAPSESGFLTDIKALRERARKHIEKGAVTEDDKADLETVLRLLNEALATEPIAAEFLVHANEEQQHANSIATRIVQLGGAPNFNPKGLSTRSHSEYGEADGLVDRTKEHLVAKRIAIDSYLEMIRYLGDRDPTTRRVPEAILAVEEEHADERSDMLHGQ